MMLPELTYDYTDEWADAPCVRAPDPTPWDYDGDDVTRARMLCGGCPVIDQCGELGERLANVAGGVWGGRTALERAARTGVWIGRCIDCRRGPEQGVQHQGSGRCIGCYARARRAQEAA